MFSKTIDFSKFSSIKIGQLVDVLMIEKGDSIPKDRVMIGKANNLLISKKPPKLMMLSKDFSYIKIDNGMLKIGCSTPTGKIVSFARRYDIFGFEFLSKLPGTLGGVIRMNAGVKGYEIFNILDSIKIDEVWHSKNEIEYGYRFAKLNGVVTEAKFRIKRGFDQKLLKDLSNLRSNQPKNPSAGSTFRNPKGDYAGRLIESVGLRGFSIGQMQFSKVHANFLINLGGGDFEDAVELINLAKKRVFEEFGVILFEEVKIL